ncbi:MAG TPA: redoxin family protein [Bryobacteraceae bacterium]|nr:redoxin family protein [Bryobacteraceae bacterium]
MAESDRARRLKLLVLAAAVGVAIYAFMPKHAATSGPVKAASARKAIPEFALPAASGGEWKVADNRGKVILVNFWATWCPPCRRETPELVRIHDKYAQRGFSVVGISLDDNPESVVPRFVEQFKMSYPVLYPTADFGMAAEVQSLPTTVLVDRQGRIARTYLGAVSEDMLAGDIEQLLQERPVVPAAN